MVCNVTTYNFPAALGTQARRPSMWNEKGATTFLFFDGTENLVCGEKLLAASQKDSITSFAAACISTVKASIVCGGIAYLFIPTILRLLSVVVPYRQQALLMKRIVMKAERVVGAIRLLLSCKAAREE
ncbi:hypothetical protein [Halodesulfovibrio marinisediminis]|uniref:Uncharacterized protein n=1 Tax=Halodesulfovibrio marinisediminis DSM 17456 TaxID=1121457 RepID=A0A1N6IGJ1_9BACT|nr:hypothetical protein [Halodesulfovibrio marinisediminis]SIO31142.1 hypothetical protein SAMN02745161_2733 [Halodesulfovibrio marinisediminis DSM 17456]